MEITATAESVEQARALLEAGVDRLYIGNDTFALRLPHSFSREEIKEITDYAHLAGKTVSVAVNAIFHPEKMKLVPEYLDFLSSIGVDRIVVGDVGVIHLLTKDNRFSLPYIYDGATLVTSSRQVNFWAEYGAVEAVIAREVPFEELKKMSENLKISGEILVYGATAIHQSKRPLLQNYYNFIQSDERKDKERDLFLSEPKAPETHYSIYEDEHGTHIFANNDINLMLQLDKLKAYNYTHWKLDGIYTKGEAFVEIAKLFVQAKKEILAGSWDISKAALLDEQVRKLHPKHRGIDEGFFHLDPKAIV
ncbi:Collagenase-like protease, PrtC family [Pilibacter termitis]|uniref:Collagenase-like protease, PrtC family n=1 Tax=Pilibacter termitis TaxID=263852 RepID=A0A1T4P2D9_9ENTE|nr:peptidase U32 family protein [Pilibacter termitis]SJZ85770.1 Collagenase-like protease, PrtC family [Pilibacter termitis]